MKRAQLAVLLLVMAVSAHAGVITWTNTSSGNWSLTSNWSPNQVPGAGDSVFITNSGTYTVILNVSASPASLTLGGASGTQTLSIASSTLTFGVASSVIGNGVLELSGGVLSGTGTLTISNGLNWTAGTMSGAGWTVIAPGATLNLANSGDVSISGRTLENAGTVLWTGGGNLICDNGVVLTNRAGALWEVRNDRSFVWQGGAANRFDNAGTFRKAVGPGTTTFSGNFPFNNYGTVDLQSGTLLFNSAFNNTAAGSGTVSSGTVLRLAAGGSASGTFENQSGGVVDWAGGTYSLNSGVLLNGLGNYTNRATVTVNTAVDIQNFGLTGTLNGGGTLTVSNVLNWTGGSMSGVGRTLIAPGATLNLANSGDVSISTRALENAGTVRWTGGGNLNCDTGVVLTNRAGALWEVRNDRSFSYVCCNAADRFDNAGTFRKAVGPGTTTFTSGFPFNNYGTLSVWQGSVRFSDALSLRSSGTLEFGLAGVNYPADFGRVIYGQPLQLAGRLAVIFRGGFVPGPSQQYEVIAAPIRGTFQSYTAPLISPSLFITILYQPNAVQLVTADLTPGAPLLSIERTATNSVIVAWPDPSTGFELQQNPDLNPTNWVKVATLPTVVGGQKQVVVPVPVGNRFYRLQKSGL